MYFIYHIPGVKIGCTTNPRKRILIEQKYSEWEILEEHLDIDTASTRELELQRKYGYAIDSRSYTKASRMNTYRTEESFKKLSEGHKKRYASGEMVNALKGKKRPEELVKKLNERNTGRQNGVYIKAITYIEITTEFVGKALDINERFGKNAYVNARNSVKTGLPVKRGKRKGLQFKIYAQ